MRQRVRRLVDSLRRRPPPQPPGERPAAYYDEFFAGTPGYHKHYTESEYYFVWAVIVDRIRHRGVKSILEIGCGPGQLAHAIIDAIPNIKYVGLDFSEVAIHVARANSPSVRFEVADALTTELTQTVEYDLALSTEFLEHVEEDLRVINKIRSGAAFIGTVPSFPYDSHVRHFTSRAEVVDRYGHAFEGLAVHTFPANDKGKAFYLMEGVKR